MVTHDRSVLKYVDTVYELKHGKLVQTAFKGWYNEQVEKEAGCLQFSG